jgi:acetyl-CoA carboxylase biotin carboxylase subunit
MTRALEEFVISGVATNQAFHRRLMADPAFQRGEIDIQFLERRPDLLKPIDAANRTLDLAAAAALAEDEARRSRRPVIATELLPGGEWGRHARSEALR